MHAQTNGRIRPCLTYSRRMFLSIELKEYLESMVSTPMIDRVLLWFWELDMITITCLVISFLQDFTTQHDLYPQQTDNTEIKHISLVVA